MLSADVVIAGGGVAGLLLAAELSAKCSVVLLEQRQEIPRGKYWLTDAAALTDLHLKDCVDRELAFLDFIAYDGLTARIRGSYHLWDSAKLVSNLLARAVVGGTTMLTDHRLYSVASERGGIVVRANAETIRARLLVDCMGFGSPLVGAKRVATITGYYTVLGVELQTVGDIDPIGLENVAIEHRPIYFEAFPTSRRTAVVAVIVPTRSHNAERPLKAELNFILRRSHHRNSFVAADSRPIDSFFGIIPVGRLHTPALDRIVFFGEAGQANPATSATGLSRMLRTYRAVAASIVSCLERDALGRAALVHALPPTMSRMNRVFQESLFEGILRFNSDDFRRLVADLAHYPDDVVNAFIFADFRFGPQSISRLMLDAVRRPHGVLPMHLLKALLRY
jgi:flavin-dependent dehydrogenase